jgi:hypothetical protein
VTVGRRVEDRRVAVAVLERRGEVLARQPVDLREDRARGVAVDVGERALPRISSRPSTSKRLNSMSRRLLL